MDPASTAQLSSLLRDQRVAALGTLRQGEPLVTLTLFLPASGSPAFYILASSLAYHTQDMQANPAISLMIAEPDLGRQDPQTLARLSIRGTAEPIPHDAPEKPGIQASYLARFPDSAPLFEFADFSLYLIRPQSARFVAGFGRAFNLTPDDLVRATSQPGGPRKRD